jgi:hypothetical protein
MGGWGKLKTFNSTLKTRDDLGVIHGQDSAESPHGNWDLGGDIHHRVGVDGLETTAQGRCDLQPAGARQAGI